MKRFSLLRVTTGQWEFTVAILLTLVLIAVHVVFLFHAGPLWRDEISSLNLATKPTLAEFWRSLTFDPFPAGYFVFLRFWSAIGFGDSDFALRALGLFVGVLLIGALWVACNLIDKSPPFWPLALFAFNPLVLEAGDSLRPYGFSLIWVVLAFALLWRITFGSVNKSIAFFALVVVVLAVQSAFTNALMIFAVAVGAAAVLGRKGAWSKLSVVVGIGALAALSLAPYVPIIRSTQEWAVIVANQNDIATVLAVGRDAIANSGAFAKWTWISLIVATLLALSYVLVFRGSSKDVDLARDRFVFAAATLLVAGAVTIGFLSAASYLVFPRYFLAAMAMAALCISVFWNTLPRRMSIRALSLGLAILVALTSLGPSFERARMRMTNSDKIAAALAKRAGPDDLVVVTSSLYGISVQRYYHGQADWIALPPLADFSLHRWDLLKQAIAGPDPVPELLSRMQNVLQAGHKVFLVGKLGPAPATQPDSLPPAPLSSFGWQFEAYTSQWKSELTYWIEHHALHGTNLSIDENELVNPFEELGLFEISGLREL